MRTSLIFFLLCISYLQAQFPLSVSEFPQADTFLILYDIDTAGVSYVNAGANATWDFSGASFNPYNLHDTFYTYSPQNIPGYSNFPNANFGQDEIVSLGFFASATRQIFIDKTNNYLNALGFHIPYTDLSAYIQGVYIYPQTFVYTSADTLFSFPFSFGDSVKYPATYQKIYVGTTQDTILHAWTQRTVQADGYGTLKLPSGRIFNNALRIKITTLRRDTIEQVGLNTDLYYDSVTVKEYIWFVQDTGMVFKVKEEGGRGYSPLIGFMTLEATQIQEINPPKITTKVSENFSKKIPFSIQGRNLIINNIQNSQCRVYTLSGQKIADKKLVSQKEIITLPHKGMYILILDNQSFKIYIYE